METERLDPLFFGPPESQLFGCHHAPLSGAPRLGVAIAPAVGHEYSRAHRALRQLALQCSGAGLRSLRFDLRGTGDSAGDAWPSALEPWTEDLELAQRELALRARVARTALVGVRLSGALALSAAARHAGSAALVLWDPILDGRAYAQELEQAHSRFESGLHSRPARDGGAEAGLECLGFRWSAELLASLRAWRPPAFERAPAARVLLLEARRTERSAELAAALARSGARVSHEDSSGSQPWNEDVDRGLVPAADVRRIADFLREESP